MKPLKDIGEDEERHKSDQELPGAEETETEAKEFEEIEDDEGDEKEELQQGEVRSLQTSIAETESHQSLHRE